MEIPEGVTKEDIADPQNMNNNNCASYLELLVSRSKAQLDQAISEERPVEPRIKKLWLESMTRLKQLENACGSGTLSPEDYVDMIKTQKAKDV